MRVIPVIDLKKGLVVRGVAGAREHYQPIVSAIAADARPGTVATAFVQQLNLRQIYVADLDAIAGAEPNWEAYRAIAASGATLLIDAGIRHAAAAQRLIDFAAQTNVVAGVIAALESCSTTADISEIFAVLGARFSLFSLDLMAGVPRTNVLSWSNASAEAIAQAVAEIGFQQLIVLDLADVGADRGPGTLTLCRKLRAACRKLELIAGGGIRGIDDLNHLAQSGCDAALVASSLHDGRLGAEQLYCVSNATADGSSNRASTVESQK